MDNIYSMLKSIRNKKLFISWVVPLEFNITWDVFRTTVMITVTKEMYYFTLFFMEIMFFIVNICFVIKKRRILILFEGNLFTPSVRCLN